MKMIIVIIKSMTTKLLNCCSPRSGGEVKTPFRMLDLLGIMAAVVCLIHCLALPVIMTFLPALVHQHVHDDATHVILAGWVLLFCLTAIVPGFFKHGYRRILLLMLIGLSAVLAATFHTYVGLAESVEIPLITIGNLLIISAHLYNRKLLKNIA